MITRFFDSLLSIFAAAGPAWVLAVSALLTAALARMVLAVATPRRLDACARRTIFGALLGAWLYRGTPRLVVRQVRRLAHGATLLFVASLPALVLLVPPGAAMLLALEQRYERAPATVGDAVVVTATFASDKSARRARLHVPAGLRVEQTVVVPAGCVWRVRVLQPGVHQLAVRPAADSALEYLMPLVAAPHVPVPGVRTVAADAWFDPQPTLGRPATAGVREIRVQYIPRDVRVLGWRMHWLLPWLLLTFAFVWLIPGRPPEP